MISIKNCLNKSLFEKSARLLCRKLITNKIYKRNISMTDQKYKQINDKNNHLINELKRIQYENKFHEMRKLEKVLPHFYKQLVTEECLKRGEKNEVLMFRLNKISIICKIYNKLMEKTFRVPAKLTYHLIQDLIDLNPNQIEKGITFFYEKEFKRWFENELRIEESIKTQERLKSIYESSNCDERIGIFNNDNQLHYGLWHNTLFTRIKERQIHTYIRKTKLKTAAIFGQNIVIDFGYEQYMNRIAVKELLAHILKLFNFNKNGLENPFNINFNNYSNCGLINELMPLYIKKDLSELLINCSSDSYMSEYQNQKLVYVCPQANEILDHFDSEAVYVLCGVVQKRMDLSLTMSRVIKEGIEMRRLPVEHFVNLKEKFCLELSDSFKILAHLRDGSDMTDAVQKIFPKYSIRSQSEVEDEDEAKVRQLLYSKMIKKQRKLKTHERVRDSAKIY